MDRPVRLEPEALNHGMWIGSLSSACDTHRWVRTPEKEDPDYGLVAVKCTVCKWVGAIPSGLIASDS